MKKHFVLTAVSALTYYLSFLLILSTIGYGSIVNLSVPWYQWPFELLMNYFVYVINSILTGNLRYYLYISLLAAFGASLAYTFKAWKQTILFTFGVILMINFYVAFRINSSDEVNPFLNRLAALLGVLFGTPLSLWLAFVVSGHIHKKLDNTSREQSHEY